MSAGHDVSLSVAELRALAGACDRIEPCGSCASLVCPGWEAMPGGVDRDALQRVGTLRDPAIDDPTVAEYHPTGTTLWSLDAPIAPAWFPYNRCDVWRCASCHRAFLRYTEYGGYYNEERVRELDARLVTDVVLSR